MSQGELGLLGWGGLLVGGFFSLFGVKGGFRVEVVFLFFLGMAGVWCDW